MANPAVAKTKSDVIRETLVDLIPPGREFGTTDAARMVDEQLPANFDRGANFSSLVSSALGAWVNKGRIVRGHALDRVSPPAHSARWIIRRISPEKRVSVRAPALKTLSKSFNGNAPATGERVEVEIVEVRPNGDALVRFDDRLYTLRQLDW